MEEWSDAAKASVQWSIFKQSIFLTVFRSSNSHSENKFPLTFGSSPGWNRDLLIRF
jgi:hypothetical protein